MPRRRQGAVSWQQWPSASSTDTAKARWDILPWEAMSLVVVAEAVLKYRAQRPWWLDDATEKLARDETEERFCTDSREGRVADLLTAYPEEVSLDLVLREAFDLPVAQHQRQAQMAAAGILQRLGWKRVCRTHGGKRSWVYVPMRLQ